MRPILEEFDKSKLTDHQIKTLECSAEFSHAISVAIAETLNRLLPENLTPKDLSQIATVIDGLQTAMLLSMVKLCQTVAKSKGVTAREVATIFGAKLPEMALAAELSQSSEGKVA